MIKKLIITTLIILIPTSSFGITLGSSLALSAGSSKLTTKEKNVFSSSKTDSNIDLGFSYKYNWNIEGIIAGVEFFYDYLNISNFFDNAQIDFRYRYGINLNLGYNIFRNFSFYGIIGWNLLKYKANNHGANYYDKYNEMKTGVLYGLGIGYDLSTNWKIALEYQYQNTNIHLYNEPTAYNFDNTINTIKFFIVYKF